MSKNRVEELEAKVAELESTVDGLTEELVAAKERIRDLEAELEPEPADGRYRSPERAPEPRETKEAAPEDVEAAAADADSGAETGAEQAAQEGESVEEDKSEATEPKYDIDAEREDDIIIA